MARSGYMMVRAFSAKHMTTVTTKRGAETSPSKRQRCSPWRFSSLERRGLCIGHATCFSEDHVQFSAAGMACSTRILNEPCWACGVQVVQPQRTKDAACKMTASVWSLQTSVPDLANRRRQPTPVSEGQRPNAQRDRERERERESETRKTILCSASGRATVDCFRPPPDLCTCPR